LACEQETVVEAIWRSPMAVEWIKADEDTLLRIAFMREAESRGQANATLRAEIRQLEALFGLSPMARRKLGWEIGPDGGANVQPDSNIRRLRAVDPDIAAETPDRWPAR
jgi:hypothetical protein